MLIFGNDKPQNVGVHPLPSPEYPAPISPSSLQNIFDGCSDFEARRISAGGSGAEIWVCWLDGVTDSAEVAVQILRPLTEESRFGGVKDAKELLDRAAAGQVYAGTMKRRDALDDLVSDLTGGYCALVTEGQAVSFQVKTSQKRSVDAPQAEKTVKGGKDAFVETLRVNTALVRLRLRTPKLKLKSLTVGRKSRSDVAVLWVDKVARSSIADEVCARLERLDIDGLMQADILQQALSDTPQSPFPQIGHTERCDAFCMALLDGRVGILCEGIPLGFLAPGSLPALMSPAEDESQHFLMASALRLLRWGGMLLTLLLPAFYVATAMYHQEMIPLKLLLSVIESKQDVPFSTPLEILGMLIAFELLQEAGLRLPDPVGQTVSIVGALIVGQSAVEARVISPIAVIVVAVAGIAGYTVPNQDLAAALRLARFALVLAAVGAGMFGIAVGCALLLWHLCSLESFGAAYISPLATGRRGSAAKVLTRPPETELRPEDINGGDLRRRAP